MTEKLQKTIEEELGQLPKEGQDAIASIPWIKLTEEIGINQNLSTEEIESLQLETLLVLISEVAPKFFAINIENHVETTKEQAEKLAQEIFDKIFLPLWNIVEKNRLEGRAESFSGAPERETSREGNEILERAGIEIIPDLPAVTTSQTLQAGKLEINTTKELKPNTDDVGLSNTPVNKEKPAPIFAQKLSGTVQTGTVKTEHTLENMSKANTFSSNPATPKIDPYREIPE